jgi:ABC-type multidrug transport system ATPase subunit
MEEPIIELKDVFFEAQEEVIIRGISHRYEEGKITALAGPSGSGKSTLLKLSAGLLVPARGAVCFRGKDILTMNRSQNLNFRREGAVVFQDSALWANQNLYDILSLPLRLHFPHMTSAERDERIREVVAEAGYKRDLQVRPALLSIGEQKLIAFARAMLCRPRLLFLDEWTESLDDDAAQRLIGIVRRMKEDNLTIILVSHDLKLIQSLADHVILISKGTIFMEATGEQFAQNTKMVQFVAEGISTCDSEYALLIR